MLEEMLLLYKEDEPPCMLSQTDCWFLFCPTGYFRFSVYSLIFSA